MAVNYLQKLVDSSGDQSKALGDVIIGGVNYGKKWSDKDAAMLNLQTAAAQQQSQLDFIADERAYNSPLEQAKRMRAAGINPDLQNIDSGNTSLSSPVSAPTSSGSPETSFTRDILPQLPSILNSALGIYQQIQGLRSIDLQLKSQQRALEKAQIPMFDDIAFKFLNDTDAQLALRANGESFKMPELSNYVGLATPHYYSNRDKRKFAKSFNQYLTTNYNKIYKSYRDFRTSDAQSKINNASTEGFVKHKGNDDPLDAGLSAFLGPIVESQYNFNKSNYVHGKKQNEFRSEIMEVEKNSAVASGQTKSVSQDLIDSLSKSYEEGNIFAGIALFVYDLYTNGSLSSSKSKTKKSK